MSKINLKKILKSSAIGAAFGLAPGLGVGYAIYKNRKDQQDYRRSKIDEAYLRASERMGIRHADIKQGSEESLTARGLTDAGDDPNTVGGQQRSDLQREFALDRDDLDAQHEGAWHDSNAQYASDLTGDATTAIKVAGTIAGMPSATAAPASSSPTQTASAGSSAIRAAMMPGVEHPESWWGGIVGHRPLDHPGSSWNRGGGHLGTGESEEKPPQSIVGDGQANYDFQVG